MKRANEPHPPAIVVRRHPPERLVRALARGEVAECCGCGACCCCLHSLGSLAGAIAGTFNPEDPPDPRVKKAPPIGLRDDELAGPAAAVPANPGPGPRSVAAAGVFWWSTAALAALLIVVQPLIWVDNGPAMRIGLVIVVLPAVLLGGAMVSALVIAGVSSLRGDIREWKRLGGITLGIVAGALIGVVLILPLFLR
jgi:hypothetical protein